MMLPMIKTDCEYDDLICAAIPEGTQTCLDNHHGELRPVSRAANLSFRTSSSSTFFLRHFAKLRTRFGEQ